MQPSEYPHFRPLLLQSFPLSLRNFSFRRLVLNRHLPHVDSLNRHRHKYSQVLCYLTGKGTLTVRERDFAIYPGATIFLPPGVPHAFREGSGRRPLCLVLEFEWARDEPPETRFRKIPGVALTMLRRELSELSRIRDPESENSRFFTSSVILRILDRLLFELDYLGERHVRQPLPPPLKTAERILLQSPDQALPVGQLAAKSGYSRDHLGRMMRASTGQSLREFRDSLRLRTACKQLLAGRAAREAGEAIGIFDQNYFSRWFKKQTGQTPTEFAKRRGEKQAPVGD